MFGYMYVNIYMDHKEHINTCLYSSIFCLKHNNSLPSLFKKKYIQPCYSLNIKLMGVVTLYLRKALRVPTGSINVSQLCSFTCVYHFVFLNCKDRDGELKNVLEFSSIVFTLP